MNDDKNISFSKGGVEADDSDIQMPSQKADQPDATNLDDVGPGRIYDFTEDLNIAPVKDTEGESTHVPRPIITPAVPAAVSPKPQPAAAGGTAPIASNPPMASSVPFPEEKRPAQNISSVPFPNEAKPAPSNKSFPVPPIKVTSTAAFQDKTKPSFKSWLSTPPPPKASPVQGSPQKAVPALLPPAISTNVHPDSVPGLIPKKLILPIQGQDQEKKSAFSGDAPAAILKMPGVAVPTQTKTSPTAGYREPIGDVPMPQAVPMMPARGSSIPTVTGKISPSNPRAKTISLETSDSIDEPEDKGNLQGTVSAMMSKGNKTQPSNSTNPNIKNLRTYEGDVADILSKRKVSTATMVMAETKKEQREEVEKQLTTSEQPEKKPSSHIFLKLLATVISLGLIGGGIFIAYYLYIQSPLASSMQKDPVRQIAAALPSLVPADSQVLVPIDNLSPLNIEARIEAEISKAQQPDSIREIVPTETVSGQTVRVTGPDMLNLMDITPPDMLVRSLTDSWMFGVYTDETGTKTVFVVATTNFFQSAFAGMLSWESVMADDLKQYVYPSGIADIANAPPVPSTFAVVNPVAASSSSKIATTSAASGTASSSPKAHTAASSTKAVASTTMGTMSTTTAQVPDDSLQPYATIRGQFSDHIIDNKDVREFRTNGGSLLFLYSFINNGELVFTTRESALSEVISRLEKQAFVR